MISDNLYPDPFRELSRDEFDALLVAVQPRLRAYVATLLGGCAAVDDIVQDTCVVLIQKRESFEPGSNFNAWAFRVAYFKASAWRRDMMREGRVMLSETAFQRTAAMAEAHFSTRPPIDEALSRCLAKLPTRDQELVRLKYEERGSLTRHATEAAQKANAVHKAISRIRLVLRRCISRELEMEPTS